MVWVVIQIVKLLGMICSMDPFICTKTIFSSRNAGDRIACGVIKLWSGTYDDQDIALQ